MLKYNSKVYRQFSIKGEKIEGRDSQKNRPIDYIFNLLNSNDLLGKTILDLGSAAGAICFESINQGAKLATGIEYDHKKFKVACSLKSKFHVKKVVFKKVSIIDFLIKNSNKFDTVFLMNILHHIHDPKLLLDLVIEREPKTIIFEIPKIPFFNSYKKFSNHKKYFIVPYSARRVIKYLKLTGYELDKRTENNFNFIGGKRQILVFRKVTRVLNESKINVKAIKDLKQCVFIGPACSGKTYSTRKYNGLDKVTSAGRYKLDSFIRSRYASLLRSRNTGHRKAFISADRSKSYYYVNPIYGMKTFNSTIRGRRYSAHSWYRRASKKGLDICYLDTPRSIILYRQTKRAEVNFSRVIPKKNITEILKACLNHEISEYELELFIEATVSDAKIVKNLKSFLRNSFYPSIVFSRTEIIRLKHNNPRLFLFKNSK